MKPTIEEKDKSKIYLFRGLDVETFTKQELVIAYQLAVNENKKLIEESSRWMKMAI
jgi:hypothetical protein